MEKQRKIRLDGIEERDLPKLDVTLILDESGSMLGNKMVVIDGFNEYIGSLKMQTDKEIYVTLAKFNTVDLSNKMNYRLVYEGETILNMDELTEEDYTPSGGTPLFDAVAKSIKLAEKRLENLEEAKKLALVLIMTDGEENSSKEFSRDQISALIQEKESENWTFVYIGAGKENWQQGINLGINVANVATYTPSQMGTHALFSKLAADTVLYTNSVNYEVGALGKATRSFVSSNYEDVTEEEKEKYNKKFKVKK